MDTRHEQFARIPNCAPRIEKCWAVVGPSQRPLTCAIYRTDMGLEVGVGYSDSARLYACRAAELSAARDAAAELRDLLNAEGVFQEIFD
jgi:hypothetical protein